MTMQDVKNGYWWRLVGSVTPWVFSVFTLFPPLGKQEYSSSEKWHPLSQSQSPTASVLRHKCSILGTNPISGNVDKDRPRWSPAAPHRFPSGPIMPVSPSELPSGWLFSIRLYWYPEILSTFCKPEILSTFCKSQVSQRAWKTSVKCVGTLSGAAGLREKGHFPEKDNWTRKMECTRRW